MAEESENIVEGVQRLIRRSAITKQLKQTEEQSSRPFTKMIKEVRKLENTKEQEVGKLVKDLTTKEFVVGKDTVKLVQKLYDKAKEKYPEVEFGLVILGSSGDGGLEMRKMFGTEEEADLDLGIIIDSEYKTLVDKIDALVEQEIKVMVKNGDLPEKYHLCTRVRPSWRDRVNLKDAEDAYHKVSISFPANLLLYFSPTIPAKIGEVNRELILDALRRLYAEDENGWRVIVEEMLYSWGLIHSLKRNHLTGGVILKPSLDDLDGERRINSMSRTRKVRERVKDSLNDKMQSPMRKLLYSTGDIGIEWE